MHHALADGGAANALLGAVTDAVREEVGVPATQVLEPTPSRSAQVRMALLDVLGQVLSLPALLLTTLRGIAGVLQDPHALGGAGAAADPGRAAHAGSTPHSPRGATSPPPACRSTRCARSARPTG